MNGEALGAQTRAGIGYDCHRFSERRRLVLGGIEFDHPRGLEGHSDADVLTHAIIDALLGAAGLEDIGHHFPDSDERYRAADSVELLRTTAGMLAQRGLKVDHVDATIMIERPAISPVRAAMRERLAEALGLPVAKVSIKATRGEGMGFVGREEGAAALAVATVSQLQGAV
jgi:2-C-methyl-D-erythritol 2,4-cyclodiphosphate synthase